MSDNSTRLGQHSNHLIPAVGDAHASRRVARLMGTGAAIVAKDDLVSEVGA